MPQIHNLGRGKIQIGEDGRISPDVASPTCVPRWLRRAQPVRRSMEAEGGIEPPHAGFAVPRITTLLLGPILRKGCGNLTRTPAQVKTPIMALCSNADT